MQNVFLSLYRNASALSNLQVPPMHSLLFVFSTSLFSRTRRSLKRQVVGILILHVLTDPKDNSAKTNQGIADNVLNTHS